MQERSHVAGPNDTDMRMHICINIHFTVIPYKAAGLDLGPGLEGNRQVAMWTAVKSVPLHSYHMDASESGHWLR